MADDPQDITLAVLLEYMQGMEERLSERIDRVEQRLSKMIDKLDRLNNAFARV